MNSMRESQKNENIRIECEKHKNLCNLIILQKNIENHESIRLQCENHEDHENVRIL